MLKAVNFVCVYDIDHKTAQLLSILLDSRDTKYQLSIPSEVIAKILENNNNTYVYQKEGMDQKKFRNTYLEIFRFTFEE